ncbi:MAG: helix-turn-helix transcriptional regulator [Caldilineaceae bacterium]
MEKFGEKLRTLRTRRGLTTREFGELLGVSHTFIIKLEQGKKTPNVAMVIKIAAIFGVSVDQLVLDELELE